MTFISARCPDGGGFAIAAGLEQLIEYIEDLHFDEEDIAYLRGKGIFCEEFLEYLRTFRFTGDIYAVPEGTPVFPKEPMVIVRAPAIEAQLVETFALLTVNHQSLIATKANRIVRAAKGRGVMEFGSRRAQGTDGRDRRRARRLHRRLHRHGLHHHGRALRRARAAARWPTPGCRCSTPSTRPSRPTASSIPTTPPCWWTPTTRSTPASQTPSAPSTRCCSPEGHHQVRHPPRQRRHRLPHPQGARRCSTRPAGRAATITVSNSLDEYIIRDMLHAGREDRLRSASASG